MTDKDTEQETKFDSNGEPDFITEQQARDFGLLKTPEQVAAMEEEEKQLVLQLENDLMESEVAIGRMTNTLYESIATVNSVLMELNRAIDRKYGCAAQLGNKESCDKAVGAAIGIHAQKSRESFEAFRAHTTFLLINVE